MQRVVECIMNVSEGRRTNVIESLVAVLESSRSLLLDYSSDRDHNRSVFSFAGDPGEVLGAAFELVRSAIDSIDMRRHQGVHPRIGAADVIPFVPIENVTMTDCVRLAERLAHRLADIGLPVYLYGEAARPGPPRPLSLIRRGGFEGLDRAMEDDPARRPDAGPGQPHPTAGASCVGARGPLIALNAFLNSQGSSNARRIAARIRESGGGLPAVQALGFAMSSRDESQVSMNLTDFGKTRPIIAFRAIVGLAAGMGVKVVSTQLIGLVPESALTPSEASEMKLEDFHPGRYLERRLDQMKHEADPSS